MEPFEQQETYADMVKKVPNVYVFDENLTKSKKVTVVINATHGGFTLSDCCIMELEKFGYPKVRLEHTIKRDDPNLLKIIKTIGLEKACGDVYGFKMKLRLVQFDLLPTEDFTIGAYDGFEGIIIFEKKLNEQGTHNFIRQIFDYTST
jgi:hypothetical protein